MVNDKRTLTLEHRNKLSKASKKWWDLNQGSEFVKQRNLKISQILTNNPKMGVALRGIKTGTYKKCECCNKEFYALPSQEKRRFCNSKCMFDWVRKFGGWRKGKKFSTNLKRADLINIIKRCEKCGFSDSRILLIHHIDGNHHHNKRENLQLLCPNCHTLDHFEKTGILRIKSRVRPELYHQSKQIIAGNS